LRRITVMAAIGVALLITAASAYAAINTYSAKLGFTTKQAGTPKKPVAIGYKEDFNAAGTGGNRTALIDDIKTTIYGMKVNTKGLPTCSLDSIAGATNDFGCPKGALLASGYITAVVGSPTNFKPAPADPTAFNCSPTLDVWNSGGGKLTYFFVETATHKCGPLKTGSTGPWAATVKQHGKNLVFDTPVPSTVNRPAGGALAGSLETEHLVWVKSGKTTKGKKVNILTSVGCQKGKRPWSVKFTATLPTNNTTESKTVSSKAPC